ncbi:hypothetical protein TL16_g02757 [Triparma laevis f. inornata]|uniref:non-specific serine/threonine protein kinase n=1 Tax=Triparma laevis f. inornata TaxID=1714386 RepID=A0A9W7DWK7_9STRA|nr:hypothetical protein TL16_g02757 [Triparma laevis f. inornata]
MPAHSSTLCFLPASSTTDEMKGILQENDPTSSTSSSTSYLKTKLKNLAATISPRLPDTSSTINATSKFFSLYILNSKLNGEIESIPVEGCIGAYSSNSGSFINSEDSTCIQGFNWLTSAKSSIGLIKTISFESLTLTTKLSERVLNIKTTFEECLLKCLGHDDTVNVGAGRGELDDVDEEEVSEDLIAFLSHFLEITAAATTTTTSTDLTTKLKNFRNKLLTKQLLKPTIKMTSLNPSFLPKPLTLTLDLNPILSTTLNKINSNQGNHTPNILSFRSPNVTHRGATPSLNLNLNEGNLNEGNLNEGNLNEGESEEAAEVRDRILVPGLNLNLAIGMRKVPPFQPPSNALEEDLEVGQGRYDLSLLSSRLSNRNANAGNANEVGLMSPKLSSRSTRRTARETERQSSGFNTQRTGREGYSTARDRGNGNNNILVSRSVSVNKGSLKSLIGEGQGKKLVFSGREESDRTDTRRTGRTGRREDNITEAVRNLGRSVGRAMAVQSLPKLDVKSFEIAKYCGCSGFLVLFEGEEWGKRVGEAVEFGKEAGKGAGKEAGDGDEACVLLARYWRRLHDFVLTTDFKGKAMSKEFEKFQQECPPPSADKLSATDFAKATRNIWKDLIKEIEVITNTIVRREVDKLPSEEVELGLGRIVSLYIFKGVSAWSLKSHLNGGGGGFEKVVDDVICDMIRMPGSEEWAELENCGFTYLVECWVKLKEAGGGKNNNHNNKDVEESFVSEWIEGALAKGKENTGRQHVKHTNSIISRAMNFLPAVESLLSMLRYPPEPIIGTHMLSTLLPKLKQENIRKVPVGVWDSVECAVLKNLIILSKNVKSKDDDYAQELVGKCLEQLAILNDLTMSKSIVEEEVVRLKFEVIKIKEEVVVPKTKEKEKGEPVVVFEIGARVDGKFDINGRDRWFAGVVLGVEGDEYDVLYDDGDYGQGTGKDSVRKSKNRKAPPEASVVAIAEGKAGKKHSKHVEKGVGGEWFRGDEEGGEEEEDTHSIMDDSLADASMNSDTMGESDSIFMLSMVSLFAKMVARGGIVNGVDKLKTVLGRTKGGRVPESEEISTLLKILRPLPAELLEGWKKENGGLVLGSGRFGTVRKVGGFAWKVVDASSPIVDVQAVVKEIETLQMLAECDNILKMTGFGSLGDDGEDIVIVTELCSGSLKSWREGIAEGGGKVDLKVVLEMWASVCGAVTSLASNGLIHHDIKCDNIFFREGGVCVLGDFGEVERVGARGMGEARARGTECIQSPEVVEVVEKSKKGGVRFDRRQVNSASTASDVWQLGCLLFEMISGEFLFGDWCFPGGWGEFYLTVCKEEAGGLPLEKQVEFCRKAVEGEGEGVEGEVFEKCMKLMRSCLLREGGRRPGARGLEILARS